MITLKDDTLSITFPEIAGQVLDRRAPGSESRRGTAAGMEPGGLGG